MTFTELVTKVLSLDKNGDYEISTVEQQPKPEAKPESKPESKPEVDTSIEKLKPVSIEEMQKELDKIKGEYALLQESTQKILMQTEVEPEKTIEESIYELCVGKLPKEDK